MNFVDILKTNFSLSDFTALGSEGTRQLTQNVEGSFYYDLASPLLSNCSYIINEIPLTQVTQFRSNFYTRGVGTPSSLGIILKFTSGNFLVFDKNFQNDIKMNVFVIENGVYTSTQLTQNFEIYTCINPYPNFIYNTWNSVNIEIKNSNTTFKFIKFHINDSLIFEGLVDFKSLASQKFNIGIHNFNNDIMISSIILKGDDSLLINSPKIYPYWRISNIKNRLSTQFYKSIGNLKFITTTGIISDNPLNAISESYYSENTKSEKAFDGLENTYTLSASLPDGSNTEVNGSKWWIGYNFETPVELSSIELTIRSDMQGTVDNISDNSLGQEWTSFLVEGSLDGVTWHTLYSCNNTKIFKNDITPHTYTLNNDILEYTPPAIVNNKYKFWRVNNLNIDYKNLTSLQKTSASNIEFINTENIKLTNIFNTFCVLGIDPEKAFDNDLITKSTSISHIIKFQDYSIGCMFDQPVNVDSFKYIYDISDLSKWLSANIEYSYNGFDWFIKGYCEFNPKQEPKIYPILNFTDINLKHKFWKIDSIVKSENNSINYNSDYFLSALRFNTLEGKASNNPDLNNTNYGLFHPDLYLNSSNSFSTAIPLPLNSRIPDSLTKAGQNNYYSFILTETSTVKIYSESSFDTYGYLYNSSQQQLIANDNSGGDRQFLMTSTLTPGKYYIMVRAYSSGTLGSYNLVIQTNSNDINSYTRKNINYEFEDKEYVESVSYIATEKPLYCSLKSSDDGINWNFEGYLNFDNYLTVGTVNYFTLKRNIKNFFDYFTAKELSSLQSVSFKERVIEEFNGKLLDTNFEHINIYNKNNDGTIIGIVTELDIPVVREVALYDRATRQLIAVCWSNTDGEYIFTNLDTTREYYSHAIDSNNFYNAVTKDMLQFF